MMEQTSPGGDHHVQAATVLGLAQEMADRLTGEAQAEADKMLGEARTKSEQLLCDARVKAEDMVHEARTQAQTMLKDARTRVETLDRQSRQKAAMLERDAVARHTEIMTALSQEKDILEKKIDELRAFERGYHTHLKTYLDAQLHELNGHRAGVPAVPMHPGKTWWAPGPARMPTRGLGNTRAISTPMVSTLPNIAGTSNPRWKPFAARKHQLHNPGLWSRVARRGSLSWFLPFYLC